MQLPAPLSALLSRGKAPGNGKVPDVNLYPEDPFYETFFGRGLQWAVSVGRHIVIFTEIVVIGSFLSRFVLDRQLTDLNRSIVQKQSIVESYGDLEENIRSIQKQTEDIKSVLSQQHRYEVLDLLSSITPTDVKYEQVTLTRDRFAIKGKALSNRSLSVLVDNFKAQKDFERVSLNEIQSGDVRDPGIRFTISAVYKKGALSTEEPAAKQTNPGGSAAAVAGEEGEEP